MFSFTRPSRNYSSYPSYPHQALLLDDEFLGYRLQPIHPTFEVDPYVAQDIQERIRLAELHARLEQREAYLAHAARVQAEQARRRAAEIRYKREIQRRERSDRLRATEFRQLNTHGLVRPSLYLLFIKSHVVLAA
jgi:hypothetical protein